MADDAVIRRPNLTGLPNLRRIALARRRTGEANRIVVRVVRKSQRNDPSRSEDERREPPKCLAMQRKVRVHLT